MPDGAPDNDYNSMQQQAGLLPAVMATPPPIIFPGQVSAMLATGGPGAAMSALPMMNPMGAMGGVTAAFGGMPGYPGMGMMPGAGVMGGNPYAHMPQTSPFSPALPPPPPMYAGQQATAGFGVPSAGGGFNTVYGTRVEQQMAEEQSAFANRATYGGVAARVGMGALAGIGGAALGGRLGGVVGATIGGLAGIAGSEYFGAGQFAQNTFMNQVMSPFIQQRGFATGIEHASAHFMPMGAGPMGVGFSAEQAREAARGITDMGNSASFRRETFDRFNSQDLAKITQGAAHAGLMSGVQDVEGMTSRVRDVAKSLNAFMELAQEPDIQRAIQTMGNLRSSGLNLSETLGAVQSGRSFARAAGMSFQEMADVGGAAGSQMFQGMGLSGGLGFRAGMANLGIAAASENAGVLGPGLMSMVRGAQGLSAMNNQFSANMLQMPMLAPAMMSGAGGLNANALQTLMSGGTNLFSMTGAGANNLTGMTGRYGIEGLGMAVSMQPYLQDQIGRIMQSQGPYMQRNMEDTQIMGLARGMGMRGSAGFITAARAAGMSESQAIARAQEMTSPTYFAQQRSVLAQQRREARAQGEAEREANTPGVMDTLRMGSAYGDFEYGLSQGYHHLKVGLSRAFGGEDAYQTEYVASTDSSRRRAQRMARSQDQIEYQRRMSAGAFNSERDREMSIYERLRTGYALSEGVGGRGLVAGINAIQAHATFSDDQLRAASRDFALGGRLSTSIFSGNRMDEMRAARDITPTFGQGARGVEAMAQFASNISTMPSQNMGAGSMALNALVRGGAMTVSGGMLDPGNILGTQARTGTDYRRAFVEAMTRTGQMDARQATETFNRDPNAAITRAAPLARLMMTRLDRENLEQSADIGQTLTGARGTSRQAFEAARTSAMEDLLGRGSGAEAQRGYHRGMDRIEGLGREGTEKHERSRYIIGALAMAAGTREGGPDAARRSRETMQRVVAQAAREGFSSEDINAMIRRADVQQAQFSTGEGQVAARAFMENAGQGRTGRDILDRFQRGDEGARRAQSALDAAGGFAQLGRGGGVLGGAFQGMTEDRFDQNEVERRLGGIASDPDKIRQLRGEGAYGRRMADLLERYRRGDQRALRQINELATSGGQEATTLRQKFREENKFTNFARRLFGRDEAVATAEQRYVNENLTPRTPGEQAAERGVRDSLATEGAARDMGIGGAGDALVEASRDLKEVAQLFRDTIGSGGISNLVTPPE
jgi:hypothetical protein